MTHQAANSSSQLSRLTRAHSTGPARPWKPILLVIFMVLGLLLLLWAVLGDRLKPAIEVEVTRVMLRAWEPGESFESPPETSAQPHASEADMLFQSSGWIEADPWLVRVPVLADGFVESILITEGQVVTNGQVLVHLVDTDARLALEGLEISVARLEAEVQAHLKGIQADESESAVRQALQESAAARLKEAEERWARIRKFNQGEVSRIDQIAAESAVLEARAEVQAAAARHEQAGLEVEQQRALHAVKLQEVREMKQQLEVAQLRLDRMVIRAPIDGVVQQRLVEPGAKRMASMDDPDSATVVTLYNPERLQVRVDVPLAEAGKLLLGQATRMSTAMLPGKAFSGTVTRIAGEADLQRNTLQVKVALASPDPRLRPEVLCRVAFLRAADAADEPGHSASSGHALWIPEKVLGKSGEASSVWVVDPLQQTVHQQEITLGTRQKLGYRQVSSGLQANQLLVVSSRTPLHEGARVRYSSTLPESP